MKRRIFVTASLFFASIFGAHSNACLTHIQNVERQEGIPRNLLMAMARVESGRYNEARKTVEPWPWTVQHGGKSNYFSTKAEAVSHVKSLMMKGYKNIDVGCMQMNIEHHGHKFATLEDMFEPAHNVAQSAKYLKQLKSDRNAAWSTAVGNYHSHTPVHHDRYKKLVLKNLSLMNKDQSNFFTRLNDTSLDSGAVRGSLFPAGRSIRPIASNGVKASLYHYSRSHGMTGVKRPVQKHGMKHVKVTSKGRIAQMKGNGVKANDLAFMNKKD